MRTFDLAGCRKVQKTLPVLDNVNTQAAEQTFSWIGQYAPMISSMSWLRAPIFILILFHFKNLSLVGRKPTNVFNVVRGTSYSMNVSDCFLRFCFPWLPLFPTYHWAISSKALGNLTLQLSTQFSRWKMKRFMPLFCRWFYQPQTLIERVAYVASVRMLLNKVTLEDFTFTRTSFFPQYLFLYERPKDPFQTFHHPTLGVAFHFLCFHRLCCN